MCAIAGGVGPDLSRLICHAIILHNETRGDAAGAVLATKGKTPRETYVSRGEWGGYTEESVRAKGLCAAAVIL